MIVEKVKRLRRAAWTWRQPLTRRPTQLGASVSDLFVWRNSADWKTSFELMDISGLFPEAGELPERFATMYCFDLAGRCFLENRLDLFPGRRQTIELAELVGDDHGEAGTFAVFHSATPKVVTDMGSYLAERGYVSFRFKDAPLRAYVHGNLDAISRIPDGSLELLGGSGLMSREYCLQHEMTGPALYELALVNPTAAERRCTFQLVSARSGKKFAGQNALLKPGGAALLPFHVDASEPVRAIIKSDMIMARPLVFRIQNLKLDVFHG